MSSWIVTNLWLIPAVPLSASFIILSLVNSHRRTAAAHQALIGQQDMPGPGARRRDRRVHAGASGPDNQHIGGEIGHVEDLVPLARIAMIGTAKPSPRR